MFAKNKFYSRTGLNPHNVIFCRAREGIPKEKLKFLLLKKPKFTKKENLIGFGYEGARTASVRCGKGAVAKEFRLNYLIDDREDCLKSFFYEGMRQNGF